MKILVVQQKMIGDVLTSSILFEVLRAKYPEAELHYLINTHTFAVVENNPFIDKVVYFTPEIENSKLKLYSFLKDIKKENYDAVIDVYGKLSSALISLFSGAKIKSAYRKKHTAFIYSDTIIRAKKPTYKTSLAIENRLKLVECLGIEYQNCVPKIYLTTKEQLNAKQYLASEGLDFSKPIYMISVLGSNPNKTYPFEYMAKTLDFIIKTKPEAQLLFNYIPKQIDDAKSIYDACNKHTKLQIAFNVFGKSLREFLAITSHCDALIGNEGGAVNMAKALNIKTFTMFSPALNKHNWFGQSETKDHVAVHLGDYTTLEAKDYATAKKEPKSAYLKFKPEYFTPKLKDFLSL